MACLDKRTNKFGYSVEREAKLSTVVQLPSTKALRRHAKEYGEILKGVLADGVPTMTAFVVAGDIQSARRVDEMIAAGKKPRDVVWFVGSYARFDWAVSNLTKRQLFAILPDLWVGSDPDDTKPEYLALWKEARSIKGRTITDGKALPKGRLTIYRGQIGSNIGISWTLDKKIAEKFAATGGGRGFVRGGKILRRTIDRDAVIAYLTSRNESEIIYDSQA